MITKEINYSEVNASNLLKLEKEMIDEAWNQGYSPLYFSFRLTPIDNKTVLYTMVINYEN